MPMSKTEFKTLVSTEIQLHGKFYRENVLAVDLPAFAEIAIELNANMDYALNEENGLYLATIKQ